MLSIVKTDVILRTRWALPVENSGYESFLSGVHTPAGLLHGRPQADVGAGVPGHLVPVGGLDVEYLPAGVEMTLTAGMSLEAGVPVPAQLVRQAGGVRVLGHL